MNPDLIEYQKMIMAQQAPQPPRQYAPMQMPQSQPMPQSSGNPIQMGAMSGMESAKHSLGMDSHERQRAMGHGMLKFFSQMGKTGHGPGLAGALGAINSSFLPGVEGFQAEENAVMNRNYTLMKQQQEMQRHAEDMNLKYMEAEDRRKHREMTRAISQERNNYLKGKAGGANVNNGVIQTEHGNIDLSQYPAIQTAAQKTLYAKKYDNYSVVTKDLDNIKRTFDELTSSTKDNIFAPVGSIFGGIPNSTKDILGRVAGDTELGKKVRKENMLRQSLESQFARLEPVLEKSAKGGAPDARLLQRFHDLKVYMNSSQPAYILKDRINELMEDTKSLQGAAQLSLLTGRQIPLLPKAGKAEEDGGEETREEAVPEHTNSVLQEMNDDQKQEIIAATRAKYPQLKNRDDEEILTWAIERPEKAAQ
jgi:hypothetical protein